MRWSVIPLVLLLGCSWYPKTLSYQEQYRYLEKPIPEAQDPEHSRFVVLLVDARHLDYTDQNTLTSTITKHPQDGSKNSDVGHAWVMLYDGKKTWEGGHASKEEDPGYYELFKKSLEDGDPNPVRHFWADRSDGMHHDGSHEHTPTLAALVPLTPSQYDGIRTFVDPNHYNYTLYNITEHQCSTMLTSVAELAGLHLENKVYVRIDPEIELLGIKVRMRTDPYYEQLVFASPDRLEQSLREVIREGKAQNVTDWYIDQQSLWIGIERGWESVTRFPFRFARFLFLNPTTVDDDEP